MLSEDKYFQTLTQAQLWQRYCGFLDLSIDRFLQIQRELLTDQIDKVGSSVLGQKIMGTRKPNDIEEFRRIIPLTTYDDYEPYLSERREDALAVRPYLWCHSAGRGGCFKWVPHSSQVLDNVIRHYIGSFILATSRRKGDVIVRPGLRLLATTPPPPYGSGFVMHILTQRFSLKAIPRPELAGKLEFQERIQKGFQTALRDGVDVVAAIASILVKIGEGFTRQTRSMQFSISMLHPKVLLRLLRAWLRSKMEHRPILPKDLWAPKGIMVTGMDTAIYADDVAYYWGSEMHEVYAMTEALMLSQRSWNKKAMTFVPDVVFLEFIPYEEQLKHKDESYQPSTVLMNELEKGRLYEVVITQFFGMPLLRYRTKDLIKVVALKDDEAQVNLPQIEFQRRVDETINLASLCQLDEKTLWRAIANTGIRYFDWSACKEHDQGQSFLRLYLELQEDRKAKEIETMIDEQLKAVDVDYRDISSYLDLQPVRVTLLSTGTFQRYMEQKRKEGADLAHIKPNHINPSEEVVQRLLQLNEVR